MTDERQGGPDRLTEARTAAVEFGQKAGAAAAELRDKAAEEARRAGTALSDAASGLFGRLSGIGKVWAPPPDEAERNADALLRELVAACDAFTAEGTEASGARQIRAWAEARAYVRG